MLMKYLLGIAIAIAIILLAWLLLVRPTATTEPDPNTQRDSDDMSESTVAEPGTYSVSPEESEVEWTASKPLIPGYVHVGSMTIQEGTLNLDVDTMSGEIVIDMNQVRLLSMGGGKDGNESRLETHLKSEDFFDVANYPTARFVITQASETEDAGTYMLTGSLTMKESTQDISFPARVFEQDGNLRLTADFEIDRTRWNITYGSAGFFDSLADNAISDTVGMSLDLVATPDAS